MVVESIDQQHTDFLLGRLNPFLHLARAVVYLYTILGKGRVVIDGIQGLLLRAPEADVRQLLCPANDLLCFEFPTGQPKDTRTDAQPFLSIARHPLCIHLE